jgi:hypothetical protein
VHQKMLGLTRNGEMDYDKVSECNVSCREKFIGTYKKPTSVESFEMDAD